MGQFTNQGQANPMLMQMLQGILSQGQQQGFGMGGAPMNQQQPMQIHRSTGENVYQPPQMQNAWQPTNAHVAAYQQYMQNPSLQGIQNASEIAAHQALFGANYGGLRDYSTPEGMQVNQLMQMMNQPKPGDPRGFGGTVPPLTLPPGGGYPIGEPQTPSGLGGGFEPPATLGQMNPAGSFANQPNPMQKAINRMNGGNPMNPWIKKPGAL